jgi:APA family basic amino acid/polyamine antiporter
MANFWVRKPLSQLLASAGDSEKGLKRTLGAYNLVALGIGAIIGAGLFVRTAAAAAEAAGPSVTLSFVVAAIGCAFAGLCYAEFAAMIPVAGSAYTYAYATMGELLAWIIGWALIMEYALGAATVSIAWSEYLNNLLGGAIPYEWCHSPFEQLHQLVGADNINQLSSYFATLSPEQLKDLKIEKLSELQAAIGKGASEGLYALNHDLYEKLPANLQQQFNNYQGMVNAPALIILLLLTLLLIRGTQQSAFVNAIIVFIKVAIVLIFIVVGWGFINPDNYDPYFIKEGFGGSDEHTAWNKWGWGGVLGGAGIVFFAFIGFDAVSTAAQESKNPKRDMPIGILGSLAICTVLYILFSHVLTGVANWSEFKVAGKEASVTYAIEKYMTGYSWLATGVTVAILAGFSSVILVMLLGQSRVFYSMSNDGLLPKAFSDLHPRYRTPFKANWILFVFVGLFAAFIPGSMAGDLTSFGTLLAFVLVSLGVWMMRRSDPGEPRPFRTPLVPLVPILGAVICTLMIIALDQDTLKAAALWMAIGLVVYFVYSRHHSKLQK